MSDKQTKQLRKQLRNIVQEIMPGLLSEALQQEIYRKVSSEMHDKLSRIERDVKTAVEEIDNRAKDVHSYLMRAVQTPLPPQTEEKVDEKT